MLFIMIKKRFIFLAVAAGMALAACNTLSETEDGATRSEIRILALQRANTKSPLAGIEFPEGYDLKVSAYRNLGDYQGDGDHAADYFANVTFSRSGTVWKEAKYWPLDGSLDFLAYATAGLKDAAKGVRPTAVWGDNGIVARKLVLTVPDNSEKFDDILYGASNHQVYSANGNAMVLKHAGAVVCFAADANVEYDAVNNKGVTIDRITVDNAYYAGTLTILNPEAAGGAGTLSATWSNLGSQKTHVAARAYGGLPCVPGESELSGLNLSTEAADFDSHPFGNGYVILPEQTATRFTITYTLHNGKNGDGTNLNNQMQYQYRCSGTWAKGTKTLYTINIRLTEITIDTSVEAWQSGTPVISQ